MNGDHLYIATKAEFKANSHFMESDSAELDTNEFSIEPKEWFPGKLLANYASSSTMRNL